DEAAPDLAGAVGAVRRVHVRAVVVDRHLDQADPLRDRGVLVAAVGRKGDAVKLGGEGGGRERQDGDRDEGMDEALHRRSSIRDEKGLRRRSAERGDLKKSYARAGARFGRRSPARPKPGGGRFPPDALRCRSRSASRRTGHVRHRQAAVPDRQPRPSPRPRALSRRRPGRGRRALGGAGQDLRLAAGLSAGRIRPVRDPPRRGLRLRGAGARGGRLRGRGGDPSAAAVGALRGERPRRRRRILRAAREREPAPTENLRGGRRDAVPADDPFPGDPGERRGRFEAGREPAPPLTTGPRSGVGRPASGSIPRMRRLRSTLPVLPLLVFLSPSPSRAATAPVAAPAFDAQTAARFADLALACVAKEYPNKIAHVMASDADAKPPRELTPAFFGCYDWHSAVHGHWLLARLARTFPEAPFAARARAALGKSLTSANVAGEVRYLDGPGRVSFERPYGLAWLLQLGAELRGWDDPEARA